MEYCFQWLIFGPAIVRSWMVCLGWHSSRSLTPGMGKGKASLVHLETLQTISKV